jgi:CheY-like chemotaxis protein
MSCPDALHLFDLYQQALMAFHGARKRLQDYGDYEWCFAEARRARAEYWKHVEAHGCRTPAEAESNGKTKTRILIVDDQGGIRRLLASAFSKAGFEVRTAAHAWEAINLMDAESIDAVLSDVVLDSVSGHDLVRWVAAHHPDVICVLMTGFDQIGCNTCPFADGCTVLRKPFHPKEAVTTIHQALTALGEAQ